MQPLCTGKTVQLPCTREAVKQLCAEDAVNPTAAVKQNNVQQESIKLLELSNCWSYQTTGALHKVSNIKNLPEVSKTKTLTEVSKFETLPEVSSSANKNVLTTVEPAPVQPPCTGKAVKPPSTGEAVKQAKVQQESPLLLILKKQLCELQESIKSPVCWKKYDLPAILQAAKEYEAQILKLQAEEQTLQEVSGKSETLLDIIDFQAQPKVNDFQAQLNLIDFQAQPNVIDFQAQPKLINFQALPNIESDTMCRDISDFPALLKPTDFQVKKNVFNFGFQDEQEVSCPAVKTPSESAGRSKAARCAAARELLKVGYNVVTQGHLYQAQRCANERIHDFETLVPVLELT